MKKLHVLIVLLVVVALSLFAGQVSGFLDFTMPTSLSNPASGYMRLGFKSDGKLYSRTSAGVEAEIGAGGGGTSYDPTSVQWMHHKEEFPSGIWQQSNGVNTGWHVGENAWYFESNGGTGASVQPEVPSNSDAADGPAHPGRWKVQSGATTSQWGELKLASYAAENPWFSASKLGTKFVWVFRLGTATQQVVYVGLARDGNIATSNFIGARYSAGASASTFYLTARTYGGTAGEYDTGITGDATTWHTLTGRVDDAVAGKIWLSLDGGAERSFCASGCDTAATTTGVVFTTSVRVQASEAVNKFVVLDYYGAKSQISATEVRP